MAQIIEIKGARSIHIQTKYGEPAVEAIKGLGGKWDAETKSWKVSRTKEAELLKIIEAVPATKDAMDEARLKKDRENILGTANYNGKSYFLVGEGKNERGGWARLMFRDGSKTFFKVPNEIEIAKRYRQAVTLEFLTRRDDDDNDSSEETKNCWECGMSFTYRDARRNEGDWRDGYCGC